MAQIYDLSGNDVIVNGLYTGATSAGQSGSLLAAANVATLAGVVAGTASASKALVLDASSNIAGIGTVGLAAIDSDSGTLTLSGNAGTATKWFTLVTSEALTTAAGASQAFTITFTGVAAGDFAFVQDAGGTNTRMNHTYKAVTTTNTVTVTVYNNEPTNAINGTLIFNLMVIKK